MRLNKKVLAIAVAGALGLGSIASIGLQAFAQTISAIPAISNQQPAAQAEQTTEFDTDNIQGQTNDGKLDSTLEANETEGAETPETGLAAEAPGGHEDVGVSADRQFEGGE